MDSSIDAGKTEPTVRVKALTIVFNFGSVADRRFSRRANAPPIPAPCESRSGAADAFSQVNVEHDHIRGQTGNLLERIAGTDESTNHDKTLESDQEQFTKQIFAFDDGAAQMRGRRFVLESDRFLFASLVFAWSAVSRLHRSRDAPEQTW